MFLSANIYSEPRCCGNRSADYIGIGIVTPLHVTMYMTVGCLLLNTIPEIGSVVKNGGMHVAGAFLKQEPEQGQVEAPEPVEVAEVPSPAHSSASEESWEGGSRGPLDGAALRRLAATRRIETRPPIDIDGEPCQ